jgi:hypothetical protein
MQQREECIWNICVCTYIPFPFHSLAKEGIGAKSILDRKCTASNKKSYRKKLDTD